MFEVSKRLENLLKRLKELPPPTERERQEQTLSFAWGNLACSTNHKPSRSAFKNLARERYGWTDEEFDAWADRMRWERD